MTLNYKEYGQGEPLIILHGLFGTLDNWQTLAKQWAAHYTVFAIDLRNHGRSPFADTHTYADLADDLNEFMEAHWIHRTHLLGHSMGGKVALKFLTEYEDKIDRLVVVDIGTKAYAGGHEKVFEALFSVDLATQQDRKQIAEQLALYLRDDNSTLQFLLKNLSRNPETALLEWKMNLPVLHQYYSEILGEIRIPKPIATPTLFVRGSRSNYISDADFLHLKTDFPNAELATIPDAGHWVHAENGAALFTEINRFLG